VSDVRPSAEKYTLALSQASAISDTIVIDKIHPAQNPGATLTIVHLVLERDTSRRGDASSFSRTEIQMTSATMNAVTSMSPPKIRYAISMPRVLVGVRARVPAE
jgi:hypothetical protein